MMNLQAKAGATPPTFFGPATLIATLEGELPVEWLASGDRIITRDYGAVRLRSVTRQSFSARQIAEQPALRPVELTVGLASPSPRYDMLYTSAQTRVLLRGADIELCFGIPDALAEARHLGPPAPPCVSQAGYTGFALMLDKPGLIRANGVWCLCSETAPPRPLLRSWEAGLIADLRHKARPEQSRAA